MTVAKTATVMATMISCMLSDTNVSESVLTGVDVESGGDVEVGLEVVGKVMVCILLQSLAEPMIIQCCPGTPG